MKATSSKVGAEFLGVYEPNDTLWGVKLVKRPEEVDMVNSPPHYANSRIQCIDAMEAMTEGVVEPSIKIDSFASYCWLVIFKYIWRWPNKKNPIEDLKKAQYYLNKLILHLENQDNVNK